MKNVIEWNADGWTKLQDADKATHTLEVSVFAENGKVTKVITRHNDGEEQNGSVTVAGKNVLPLALDEFKSLYEKGALLFK